MAVSKVEYKILYENDSHFKFQQSIDDGDWIDIVALEENAHIDQLWDHVASICNTQFKLKMDEIGEVMKV